MSTAARCSALSLVLLLSAATAQAKSYSAEHFDTLARLLDNGNLQVIETLVFRFESGTFDRVFREIPTRRTDGIEIAAASMDGEAFPRGEGVGHVEIQSGSRVRVTWRFPSITHSTHEFQLIYVVRGVVQQASGADLLAWRALPGEHAYSIDRSTITFELPAPLTAAPDVHVNRVGHFTIDRQQEFVRITADNVRSNGWIEASLWFAPGSIIAAAPVWQERDRRARAAAPTWIVAGSAGLASALVLLLLLRQGYDAPSISASSSSSVASPPDALSPAIAGTLVVNGRPRLEQAMAALLSLAERGEIVIEERSRGVLGQRTFVLTRVRDGEALAGYERVLLDLAFGADDRRDGSVPLHRARARIVRRFRAFSREMDRELTARGLMDEGRKRVRDRYLWMAAALVIAGAVTAIPMVMLIPQNGPWPMLVPLGIIVAGVIAIAFSAATTPLSNEGIRTANAWRAYQQYLKDVSHERIPILAGSSAAALPFAIALGLAYRWSRYLKHHPADVPPWFRAIAGDSAAFPIFIAAGGAGAGSHGAGGAGGAAGGGASGAS